MVGGSNMKRKHTDERRLGLPLALTISVVLHFLVLLLSVLLPLSLRPAAAVEQQESVLKFTFAPETEEDLEGRLEGDIPIPTPEERATVEPDHEPSGLPSLQAPSSGQPATAESEAERQLMEEAVEDAAAEELEELYPELAPDEDPLLRGDRPEEEAARSSSGADGMDVGQAIQEWGRAAARAREASPRSSGGGTSRNVFQPDPSGLPATGFGVGNLVFESRDYDWSDYARQIYFAIWKAWHYRLYLTTDDFEKWAHESGEWYLRHQTRVRFAIESSGQITGIQVETPSGCIPLDDSAADALAEVILPPLPDDFPREREVVHALFIATGEVLGLRPTLRVLKERGLFGPSHLDDERQKFDD
jgi:outer membrane biosynthesis protein TonB